MRLAAQIHEVDEVAVVDMAEEVEHKPINALNDGVEFWWEVGAFIDRKERSRGSERFNPGHSAVGISECGPCEASISLMHRARGNSSLDLVSRQNTSYPGPVDIAGHESEVQMVLINDIQQLSCWNRSMIWTACHSRESTPRGH